MYIIVGLGNPGRKYENTRHNIGFITLDLLAEKHRIKINKLKHRAMIGEGSISGQKVMLVKPQTFMNLSGESVRAVMAYYKQDIESLIIIYDDIDISPGSLRIRKKGGAGTHNGMKSVIYQLQKDSFPRVRIGIGQDRNVDLMSFVTGKFTEEETVLMRKAVLNAVDAVECIVSEGIDMAMNRFNVKNKREKPEGSEDVK